MKTETISTKNLTPGMMRAAITNGWAPHMFTSWLVSITNHGDIKISPEQRSAANDSMLDARKIRSTQAEKFMLNVYGQRTVKTVHGSYRVALAHL